MAVIQVPTEVEVKRPPDWTRPDQFCCVPLTQQTVTRQNRTGKTGKPWPLPSHAGPAFFSLGTPFKVRTPLWLLFHPSVIWLTWATILTPGLPPNSLRHLMALILPPGASPPESCELYLAFCCPSLFFFPPSLASSVCPPRRYCMSKYRRPRFLIVMCVTQIKNRINTGSLPRFFPFLLPFIPVRVVEPWHACS